MNNRKHTIRRLCHVAMFSAVRAIAAATGSTTVAAIVWWIHHH